MRKRGLVDSRTTRTTPTVQQNVPGLHLAIYADAVAALRAASGPDTRSTQLWKGGIVDRTTRTMSHNPARYVVMADYDHVDGVRASTDVADALSWWKLEQVVPGTSTAPMGAGAVAMTATDIDPSLENEFNDWYSTEHIPMLSQVEGVVSARRFRAFGGATRYVALYHLANADVYRASAWESANRTAWTQRMRRMFQNAQSFIFDMRMR